MLGVIVKGNLLVHNNHNLYPINKNKEMIISNMTQDL